MSCKKMQQSQGAKDPKIAADAIVWCCLYTSMMIGRIIGLRRVFLNR